MKSTATSFLLLLILCFATHKTRAFGPAGHEMVASIAMHYLSPQAKANIQRILGTTTPEEAARWMDELRSDPSYDYMKGWHFINIEKGKSYKPGGNDIIATLERVYVELQHPEKLSKKAGKEDLMILFHLMGDLHQPLHVGYATDRGGNLVQVQFNGKVTDLHRIWDSEIIENQHVTADACISLSKVTPNDIAHMSFTKAQFVEYLKDSRALLPTVYAFTGGKIDPAYVNKNKQVLMLQLRHAGMRLAVILQQLFGGAPSTTTAAKVAASPKTTASVTSRITMEIAGKTIKPEDAISHDKESVKVCGKVYGGNQIQQTKATYLNIGAPYPNSLLTLVIMSDDLANFPNKPESYYDGKEICVTGEIRVYSRQAEMSISNRNQIQIQ